MQATRVSTPVVERDDRVHWFAGRLLEVVDDLVESGSASPLVLARLSRDQVAETVVELRSAAQRIEGLLLLTLAHADTVDVGAETAATSTGAWLAQETRTTGGQSAADVRLARALADDLEATADAVLAGRASPAQAHVISQAMAALPPTVSAEDRLKAERHLIDLAQEHDPRTLKTLGKHLLEVLDPEAAEAALGRRLEAEERRAAQRTFLQLWDDGKGSTHGSFRIPTLHGDMLRTALEAIASPKRPDAIPRRLDGEGDDAGGAIRRRPMSDVLGEALCWLVERFPADRLPDAGGCDATVVVTMRLETLLSGLGYATLSTGHLLSAAEARRLSCQAGVVPAVLGSRSEVLDLGRKVRFHTKAQRLAVKLRDDGCTVDGCGRPAAWCHVHHDVPWAAGGSTDVATGRLLCPRHHTIAHHPSYRTADAGAGKIRFTRLRT